MDTGQGQAIAVSKIKDRYDLVNSDRNTGRGKTSPRAVGRVLNNIGLTTKAVKETGKAAKAWLIKEPDLVQARQTFHLEQVEELCQPKLA